MSGIPIGAIIHESSSSWGTAEVIDSWHKDRGFGRKAPPIQSTLKHIGYHYVIENGHPLTSHTRYSERDGIVRTGRWECEQGAHALGDNSSIGICLIGRRGKFSPAQYAAMYALLLSICWRYELPPARVLGHHETRFEMAKPPQDRKTCPNINMVRVRQRLGLLLGLFNAEMDRRCPR